MSMYLSNADVHPTGSESVEFLDEPLVAERLVVERVVVEPSSTRRTYVGPGITVHWDAERCIHSERCSAGAPTVFDRDARPWVQLDGAEADAVARVIDTCPSGALSYTRTDGAPHGRRGRRADEDPAASTAPDAQGTPVTITPQADGPLFVDGPVVLTAPDGATEVVRSPTLCRCGHSGSKPRCDGSHLGVGFRAPGV